MKTILIRLACFTLSICLFTVALLQAQDTSENDFSDAMKLMEEGKLLRVITLLESLSEKHEVARQLLGQLYPIVGEYKNAKQFRQTAAAKYSTELAKGYVLSDAVEAIASEAKAKRLIVINEAHDSPEHRAFISQLIARLHQIGYTHYAFESLAEDSKTLCERGYPVDSTGFYTSEPQFGELIRNAIRIGYIPIKYEMDESLEPLQDPIKEINRREQLQCSNLVRVFFSKNADAKLLVHVGHDHVMEEPRKSGDQVILWLAARLKKETGIDPMTIDQTTSLSNGLMDIRTPVVARDDQKQFLVGGPFSGFVDVQVYHPAATMTKGRPDWLANDGKRRAIEIPSKIIADTERLLVQVRFANESDKAVPADQVLLVPGSARPMLSLRPGSYRLNTQDELGNTSTVMELDVK